MSYSAKMSQFCSSLKSNGTGAEGSALKSTGSSSRVPGINSKEPHDGPDLSVTPVPGLLTPTHRPHTDIQASKQGGGGCFMFINHTTKIRKIPKKIKYIVTIN